MSGFNQLLHTSVWFMTAAVIVNDFVLLGGQIRELCRYNSESRVASWSFTVHMVILLVFFSSPPFWEGKQVICLQAW